MATFNFYFIDQNTGEEGVQPITAPTVTRAKQIFLSQHYAKTRSLVMISRRDA